MSQNYNTDYKTYVCPSGTLNGIKPTEGTGTPAVATGIKGEANAYALQAVSGEVAQTNLSYGFIANMNENDSPDSGLTFDVGVEIASNKANHDKYGNICFVDGSVRNYAGENWANNIAYYGETNDKSQIPSKAKNNQASPGSISRTALPQNINGQLTPASGS